MQFFLGALRVYLTVFMSISCLMWSCCHLLFSTSWHLRTYHSAHHSLNAWNFINWKRNFKENIFNKYQGEKITKDVMIIRIESYFSAFHCGMKCRENYRIQLCIIRKNTQPSPPHLTPKSWKKWILDILTAPQIQHSKGLCVSSPNKRPTLQTLFFTHDVITSSNYAYLSL